LITIFKNRQLLSYSVLKSTAGNATIHAVDFKVKVKVKDEVNIKSIILRKVRTVPELKAYRNDPKGFFGVNPISVLYNL
jgi:hypothetical protein